MSVYGSVVIQVSATGKIEIFMNNFELHSSFHQSVKKLGDRKLHHIRSARIYTDGQNSNGCWPWNFIPSFSDYSTLIGLYLVVSATVKYKNKTTYSVHCSNGLVFAMKFTYRTFEYFFTSYAVGSLNLENRFKVTDTFVSSWNGGVGYHAHNLRCLA